MRAEYLWGGGDYQMAVPCSFKLWFVSSEDAVLFLCKVSLRTWVFLTTQHAWKAGAWFQESLKNLLCTLLTLKYVVAWSAGLERVSLFLVATYLEDLSAETCSKSPPNALLFEARTSVSDLCSAFLFLLVGLFLFAIQQFVGSILILCS